MILSQLVLNILVAAAIYTLVGVGFAIIFRATGFFHFTHGATFTAGAYLAYSFHMIAGLPLGIAFLLAVGFTGVLGCCIELTVYRSLRRRNASPIVLLLASLGLYVLLQNAISLLFGDDTKSIRGIAAQGSYEVLGAYATTIQIMIIAVSVVLVAITYLFVQKMRLGKALRAVASDSELARIAGIETDHVVLWVFAIGSAIAGTAGILIALDVDMTPTMGMNALMMGIVAMIIGGIRSIPGVALGALLLGMAQHLGVWMISSQWQDAIAFVILLAFLLFRPEGFMGKRIRKATV